MQRRSFLTLLGGAAAAWPLAARAQQSVPPVIGWLSVGSEAQAQGLLRAFRQGLAEAGYAPGRNVAIEFRWANNAPSLLPRLAADLVARPVNVIVTTGSPYAALAAKDATSTIPIVFAIAEDPIKYGLVTAYNRPGGNLTGYNFVTAELAGKRLDLLVKLVPEAAKIGYLSGDSTSPIFEDERNKQLEAGRALGREIVVGEVRSRNFEAAFAAIARRQAAALTVGSFTFFDDYRDKIVELAARYKLPAIYASRGFAVGGGLMSYGAAGPPFREVLARYVAQILKGTKPADLPVQQPTRFNFAINLKTAKALGLNVPPQLLAIADEVLE